MPKYKLVIFDWDGTVVNSTARIVDSMQSGAREVGLSGVSDAQVQNIIGLGLPEAIKVLWPGIGEAQSKAVIASYARYFIHESAVGMALFEGAEALFQDLLAQGHILAVATGKKRKGLDRMFRDLKLGHYFASSRCADETRSKPNPLMLNEILAELGVDKSEALMVGDTTYDLDMANAAGVASVAMGYGAHGQDILLSCKPLALCHSMRELNDWIRTHG